MRPHLRTITPSLLHEAAVDGALRHSELLRGLATSDCADLLEGARWTRLARGDTLALRGAASGHAWLVLAGYLKEHRALEDGTEVISAVRGPGDVAGVCAAMSGGPCGADLTVVTDGEALVLPSSNLRRLAASSPRFQSAVVRVLSWRAAQAEDALVRNQHADVQQRVARGLLQLLDRFGRVVPEGVAIDVPLTQGEFASWSGLSRETAAKVLCSLRRDGIVSTSRRRIVVHDQDGLRRAAGNPYDELAIAI